MGGDETVVAQLETDTLLARGLALYRDRAYGEAEAIFVALVAQLPDQATPLRLLGLCLLRRGDSAAAIELLHRAHGLAPDDPWTALHLGLGLQTVGRHDEAVPLLRACVAQLPDEPAPWLNLAVSLLSQGDAAGSLRAARKARLHAPMLAEAHYAVGQAHLARGDLAAAEGDFRAALRLAPALPDAWVNLGLARYRQGNIEGAKGAMQRALGVAPHHRAATTNLATFFYLAGGWDEAAQLLRDLLATDPDAAEARLNLAGQLLQRDQTDEALALLDAVPAPTEPGLHQSWQSQRALGLIQCGRTVEARAVLAAIGEAPAETRPLLRWREVLLATAEGEAAGACAAAESMDAALAAAGQAMLPEHRIMAHYNLAKFWSGQPAPDRAMAHWRAGHALLRQFQPFSRSDWRGFVDANIAAFSHARLHDGPRAGNADPAPVFIVGMPRSGTTLAEQILASHPGVHGAGERGALGAIFAALGQDASRAVGPCTVASLDAPALDRAAARYLAELHALAPGAGRIVDKLPGNFAWLGLVGLMLPGARIIHCTRDPRDIGLSIFSFRFHGHHPYAHDLGDLGWFIREHDRLMAHWRAALPNRILTLPLTDWIDDFGGTLARVLAYLDLPYDAACARFHERQARVDTVSRTQVRQPINARGVGRWRAYAAQLKPLLAALGSDTEEPAFNDRNEECAA